MILDKMRSCMLKLLTGFRSYGLIHLLGPSAPNIVSRPQTPKGQDFLRFHDFIESKLWFWIKWGPVCEKLMVGFWSYGLICLLGPSGPNVVSRPQTPKSKYFLRHYDFNGFILWFWKKWGPVYENWSYGSELITAWYVFWQRLLAQIALN